VLAVADAPPKSPRYKRLSRFVRAFYERADRLDAADVSSPWREFDPAAEVPGWTRFKPAEELAEAGTRRLVIGRCGAPAAVRRAGTTDRAASAAKIAVRPPASVACEHSGRSRRAASEP
jgi:hypothetical protein